MTELKGKTLLRRYFLRKHIGSGGMADVYLAWDKRRGAEMAVKVLRRDLIHNAHFSRMFAIEAELLRKLEHPNIVRIYEFQREGDIAFLVMDYVEGTNLREEIGKRKKPLGFDRVSQILKPVSVALSYAHKNAVFHCDIKPANILLHKDGRVLLSDFGVARFATHEGGGGGTYPYMAPEQFTGREVDARTDVYALGVTLYEMLSGGLVPFSGDSPKSVGSTPKERIQWEHIHMEAPSIRRRNRSLSPGLEAVVLKALSKHPNQRYGTPLELQTAFESARGGDGRAPAPAPAKEPKTSWTTRLTQAVVSQVAAAPSKRLSRTVGQPHLYGLRGELAGRIVPLPSSGEIYLGRHSANGIRFAERSVSRRHASIVATRKGIYLRDENSALGTFLNGNKIAGPTLMRKGDVIRIGHYQELEFRPK
ncbi:MAG: FHA domain-containing serine/threonine-protein kinase [Anaerolineales bacterium]|jgi:serine/threonine-protein kinase